MEDVSEVTSATVPLSLANRIVEVRLAQAVRQRPAWD